MEDLDVPRKRFHGLTEGCVMWTEGGRACAAYRENETAEEAVERRLRESQRVEERVVDIYDYEDFKKEVMEVAFSTKLSDIEALSTGFSS